MKKILSVLLMLLAVPCCAGDFGAGLDLNSVPVFHMSEPRYHDASVRFQEALFIQVGVTENVNLAQKYVLNKAERFTSSIINDYTPLKANQVYFGAAMAYGVIVKKQVSRTFRDPFLDNVTHYVTASRDGGSTGITFQF